MTVRSKIREIVSWIKTEGEKLAKGESVVVVEGETVPVGAAIRLLTETEAEIEEAKRKAASKLSYVAEVVALSPPSAASSPAPAISQPAPVAAVLDGSKGLLEKLEFRKYKL